MFPCWAQKAGAIKQAGIPTMKTHGLAADLRQLAEKHTEPRIRFGTILESLGDRGFGLLLILLSLPSAMPVPAPGYSTPFGIIIVILGIQMLAGRSTIWLPKWALSREFSHEGLAKILRTGASFFDKTEYLIRPRWMWMTGKGGQISCSLLVMLMACLMILPIPFTNTFPAMVIFLIGIGLLERDGLALLLAGLGGWVAAFVYALVFYGIYYLGMGTLDEAKEFFFGIFGS